MRSTRTRTVRYSVYNSTVDVDCRERRCIGPVPSPVLSRPVPSRSDAVLVRKEFEINERVSTSASKSKSTSTHKSESMACAQAAN